MRRLIVCGATRLDGDDADELRRRERAVLAAVAYEHPQGASTERIIELVWGLAPPATARKAVHNHVRRLRAVRPDLLLTVGRGYRLAADVGLDIEDMQRLAGLDPDDAADGDELARRLVESAGVPFEDLVPLPEVQDRQRNICRVRAAVEDLHLHVLLAAGRTDEAVARAEQLVDEDPNRERRWWLLALALARAGQRREAVGVLGRARAHLAEAGLDLGAHLAALERRIIAADPLLQVNTILAAQPGASDPSAASPVGVDLVLDGLRARLDGSAPDRVVLLRGGPGAGKTTIAQAATAEALRRGRAVYTAGCDPDPVRPLQPIVAVLEQLARRDPAALAGPDLLPLGALSPVLTAVIGEPEVPGDHHQLLGALRRVFPALTRPALVIIEDLHWAPPLTVQAVGALLAGAAAPPAGAGPPVVLLTSRPVDHDVTGGAAVTAIDVPPWTPADVLAWLAPHEADPARRAAAAGWLHRQAGGSPMFVRELTLVLLDDERLGPSAVGAFRAPDHVPAAVVAALAARVERLPLDAQRCVETAAVLGTRLRIEVLERVDTDGAPGLGALLEAGLLLPDDEPGMLVFEHELARRVALDRLAPAARAEVHHLALLAHEELGLDEAVDPTETARHAVGAAVLEPARAVAAATVAAEAAAAGGAHQEAGQWWLRAADVVAEHSPLDRAGHGHLCIRAGQALLHAGDPRAPGLLFKAAADAEDREDWEAAANAAAAVCQLGPTSTAGRAHGEATALCDRLLGRIDAPGLRARLAAATTMAHSMTGASERCRALYHEAEADAAADGRDETLVDVLPFCYLSLAAPEDLEHREQAADRLEAAAGRLGRLDARWSALHLRFSNQLQRGDPGLRATASDLLALTGRVGERQRAWEQCYVAATVAHLDDDLAGSEAAITSSLQYVDTVAESRVLAVYGVQLLALRSSEGRLDELVEVIVELVDDQPEVGAWRAALAFAAAHGGELDLARESLDAVLGGDHVLARDYTYTGALVALGEAAVVVGDPERAAGIEALLSPWSGRWSWVGTCTLGPVDTTLAGLAALRSDPGTAGALATAATRSADDLGAPGFARAARARTPGR